MWQVIPEEDNTPMAYEKGAVFSVGRSRGSHTFFDIFWQRFKVIDVESEKHGERLLECVVEFNSKNI